MDKVKMKINMYNENLEKIDQIDKKNIDTISNVILNLENNEQDLNKRIRLCENDKILKENELKKAKEMYET
jgi:hypothetical protein